MAFLSAAAPTMFLGTADPESLALGRCDLVPDPLKALHQEGGISLYAWALIVKNRDGAISVKQKSRESFVGTGLGLLTGGIVGILGGPAGAVVGGAIGSYLGLLADWARHGIDLQFLDDVRKTLAAGKAAVLGEIAIAAG